MQASRLDTPLLFEPAKWLAALRGLPPLARSNVFSTFLAGGAAPAGGSALTVIMWGAMAWAIIGLLAGRYPHRWNRPMAIVAAACAGFVIVKAAFAIGHSGLEALESLPRYLIFLAPILLLHRFKVSDPALNLDFFIMAAAIGTMIAGAEAAYQMLWLGMRRAEGFCGNPGVFAAMTCLFGAIGMLNLHSPWPSRKWLGACAFAAALFCVLASGTRTFWVAFPVLAAVAAWRAPGTSGGALRSRPLQAAAVALLMIPVLAWPAVGPRVAALQSDSLKLEESGELDSSLGRRLVLWRAAAEAIRQAPLAGYGYPRRMEPVWAAAGADVKLVEGYSHPHNGAMAAMLDAGIAGLAALAFVLLAPLAVALRAPASDGNRMLALRIACLLLAAYAASGAFGILFDHDLMDAAYILTAIVVASSVRPPERRNSDGR